MVAALVDLATTIDNGTHLDAVASNIGKRAAQIVGSGSNYPAFFTAALEGFLKSEDAFHASLRPIYRDWVLPEVETRVG